MNEVITIGVDLAKNVFQVHGVDAEGNVVVQPTVEAGAGASVLQETAALPGWHGGLCHRASLGAAIDRAWP